MIRIEAILGDGTAAIKVEGHEGHVENGLVCAAVSTIIHTALLGLEHIAAQHPDLVSITIKEK